MNALSTAYNSWSYFWDRPKSRDQYQFQSILAGISPIHRGYYDYRDNMAYMDDYLSNRGLDYSDILYPSRTDGWRGGASLGAGIRSVSRNVESLYSPSAKYVPARGYTSPMYG